MGRDAHSQAPEKSQDNVQQIAQAIGDAAGGVLGVAVSGFSLVLGLVTAVFLGAARRWRSCDEEPQRFPTPSSEGRALARSLALRSAGQR